MKREEVKNKLRELSEEGEFGNVLPAALLDIIEADELAEQNVATLKSELTASAERETKINGMLDDMQKKHDAFVASVHEKLLWSIGLSAVAIAVVLILIVMIGAS